MPLLKKSDLSKGYQMVPNFDRENGNEDAKFLFVLEAPGAKAVKSGFVSLDNPASVDTVFPVKQFLHNSTGKAVEF